jgi:hypothetical protein
VLLRQRKEIQAVLRGAASTAALTQRPLSATLAVTVDEPLEGLTPFAHTEVEHYLASGDSAAMFCGWPGSNVLDIHTQGDRILRAALVARVLTADRSRDLKQVPSDRQIVAMTRRKVGPMVGGLFSGREVDAVLEMLEHSVVFLTPDNIESVLLTTRYRRTAWSLANLYLGSIGSPLLGPQSQSIVGLSQEVTCYVSLTYFDQGDPCADFLVHEAAHIFHNCKRKVVGLPQTRTREFLLDVDFHKRETFAYACEAYSRILEHCETGSRRASMLAKYAAGGFPAEEQGVDRQEYLAILEMAIQARNGWRVIMGGCARPKARFESRPIGRPPGSAGEASDV